MGIPPFENYRFEDLEVWRISLEIVHEIYRIAKKFPREELYALTDQLKRAGTSICLNIAEGSGQPTAKLFLLYLRRARSSVLECVACAKIAVQENFVTIQDIKVLDELLKREYFKLVALEKSLR